MSDASGGKRFASIKQLIDILVFLLLVTFTFIIAYVASKGFVNVKIVVDNFKAFN